MPGKRWTTEELHTLRDMVLRECNREEVALALGKTKPAVYLQARALGLSFSRRKTKRSTWTQADDNALVFMSSFLTRKQLAKRLKRTEAAVGKRAYVLGVQLGRGRMTLKTLAAELGVSKITVIRVRDKLGLQFRKYSSKRSGASRPKGPEPEDIVAIAKYLSEQQAPGPLRASRKKLAEVIAAYGGEA